MYDLVTAGDLSIMGVDPTSQDLEALLTATSGLGGMDELSMLDRGGILSGDLGYTSIMGAEQQMAAGMVEKIKAAKLAQASLLTRADKPTKAREYPLGFLSDAPVVAGTTVTVTSRPQIVFRGERLLIPSDIAGQFSVTDIIVGKNSQKVSTTPVPGRVFDERGVGVRMSLDTAQISQDIALVVQNISGADATFRAAIIGAAVE